MCGIAGFLTHAQTEPSPSLEAALAQMVGALRHRGPDDEGIANCGLRIADCGSQISNLRFQTSNSQSASGAGRTSNSDSPPGAGRTSNSDSPPGAGRTSNSDSPPGAGRTSNSDSPPGAGRTSNSQSASGAGRTSNSQSASGTGRTSDLEFAPGAPQNDLRVALGARRLSIIDLSAAGHQPMHDAEAGLTIAYNGETYNFRELRKEIGEEFGPWRSSTDTEVVLRAYRKWGLSAFEKLRGMFALAIWDAAKQELILARDPFGIKPLYYWAGVSDSAISDSEVSNSTISDLAIADSDLRKMNLRFEIRNPQSAFLFASEVRALLASGLVPRKLSAQGVASYLSYGSVQAPLTIVENVRSLMPGQYMVVRPHGNALEIEETSYTGCSSNPGFVSLDTTAPRSREEAVEVLRAKLENSVKLHLVSDVPLGVFLSGGMDSSALVALMSRVTSEKPKTFSVVFDEKEFNEAPHSRLVASSFQTEHQEIHLRENQLLEMLPAALGAMDQPTMDAVNTFVVSKAVKEAGVTVALSGLGGDELFAGYPSFRRALRLENMSKLSRRVLRSASPIGRTALGGSVQRDKFWDLAESDGSPTDVYQTTRQLFSPAQVMNLLCNRAPDAKRISVSEEHRTERRKANLLGCTIDDGDTINRVSELELTRYMANTLLRDTDSMSMAHSLEVRVPFVDVEVARLVLSLPGNWKLNGNRPKPLLADALSDLLPAEVLQRRKMGFTLPFEKWMQSRLRSEISSVLEAKERSRKAGLDSNVAAKVWQSFLRTPHAVGWSRPWALYVLCKWCEINEVLE